MGKKYSMEEREEALKLADEIGTAAAAMPAARPWSCSHDLSGQCSDNAAQAARRCRSRPGSHRDRRQRQPRRTQRVAFRLAHGVRHTAEIADVLFTDYGIAVRAGAHCAPRMHEALGTARQGAVRFSFSYFNTEDEVDAAVRALAE